MVEGKIQIEGEVVHVIVKSCFNISRMLRQLTAVNQDAAGLLTLSRADEKSIPTHVLAKRMQEKIFSGGRNFK
jgi:error-prone DNA polymerase